MIDFSKVPALLPAAAAESDLDRALALVMKAVDPHNHYDLGGEAAHYFEGLRVSYQAPQDNGWCHDELARDVWNHVDAGERRRILTDFWDKVHRQHEDRRQIAEQFGVTT